MLQQNALQKRRIEGAGENLVQRERFLLAGEVGEDQFRIGAKFPKDLAASAAGRRECAGIGDDGDTFQFGGAFGDGFEDGEALGADGEPVGGALDIAAGEHAAVFVFDGGADLEA